MDHEVFISYKSEDNFIAGTICDRLECDNIPCWIAPRNIPAGVNYDTAIIKAIERCKVLVLIGSQDSNNSPHVISEVRKAFDEKKVIIPLFIDIFELSEPLEYRIARNQWIISSNPPTSDELNILVDAVKMHLSCADREIPETSRKKVSVTNYGFELTYEPENPPDISNFVNRFQEIDSLQKSMTTNVVVIQGIGGVGKTYLAAKLYDILIRSGQTTYWKTLYKSDTFNTITQNIAGFLKTNGYPDLYDYLGLYEREKETIIRLILKSLENSQFVLFFDNYHDVEDSDIHDLFRRLKKDLRGSTIIITSRTQPAFIETFDRVKKEITEENLEGFNAEATKLFYELMGVEISESQLTILQDKIHGHPRLVDAIYRLAEEDGWDEFVENIPDEDIDRYVDEEHYERLTNEEQIVLKSTSVFRTPFTLDMVKEVAEVSNVKIALMKLEKRGLVKRKGRQYYLHDLIREFSYRVIDNVNYHRQLHQRAFQVYLNQDNKPEVIIEMSYHSEMGYGHLTDECLDNLMDIAGDIFADVIILDILSKYTINSDKIFDLISKIIANSNIEIKAIAIEEVLLKYKYLNQEKSLEIIENLIKNRNVDEFELDIAREKAIRSLVHFTHSHPDVVESILKNIEEVWNYYEVDVLCWLLKDSALRNETSEKILKRAAADTSTAISLGSKYVANEILQEWDIKTQGYENHLEITREMDPDHALEYWNDLLFGQNQYNRKNVYHLNYIWIIKELLHVREKESIDFLDRILSSKYGVIDFTCPVSTLLYSKYGFNDNLLLSLIDNKENHHHVTALLGVSLINSLLSYHNREYAINDEKFIKFQNLIRYKSLDYLNLLNSDDALICNTRDVLIKEFEHPSLPQKRKMKDRLLGSMKKGVSYAANSKLMKKCIDNTNPGDDNEGLVMITLLSILGLSSIPAEDITPILQARDAENEMTKLMVSFFYEIMRNSPEELPNLMMPSFESVEYSLRRGVLYYSLIVFNLIPNTILRIYEELINSPHYSDSGLRIELLSMIFMERKIVEMILFNTDVDIPELSEVHDIIDLMMANFLNDENNEVRMTADLLINGIAFDG